MKKLLAIILAFVLLLGCAWAEEEDEENYETGDAALDLVRNEDEIGEKELLVVSFGTSFNDSRRLTIGGIEDSYRVAHKRHRCAGLYRYYHPGIRRLVHRRSEGGHGRGQARLYRQLQGPRF